MPNPKVPKWEETTPIDAPKWEETTPIDAAPTNPAAMGGLPGQPKAMTVGSVLQAGAKDADILRGNTTAPILGLGLEAATGKKVFTKKDWDNAADFSNNEKFPSTNEMFQRAGVPEGAKLSDYVPGYAEPSKINPWWQPEKGGMVDPTIRGTVGAFMDTAIDPMTWLSFGGSALLKKAAQEELVSKTLGAKPLSMVDGALANFGKAQQSIPGGSLVQSIATAPQKIAGWVGDRFYNTPISSITDQATKMGKENVADTLYKQGVWRPGQIESGVQSAMKKLKGARDAMSQAAEDAGSHAEISDITAPLKEMHAKLSGVPQPDAQGAAAKLEALINHYEDIGKGTPAIPSKTEIIPSSILDSSGQPIMTEKFTPGVDAIPGKKISSSGSTEIKTAAGKGFKPQQASTFDKEIQQAEMAGGRQAAENSIGRPFGSGAQQNFSDINAALGGLLSTKQGQATAVNQGERLFNRTFSPTGTDAVLGALGGVPALVRKGGADLLRLGTMPIGYALKKFEDSSMVAPMLNAWMLQKYKQKAGKPNAPLEGDSQ